MKIYIDNENLRKGSYDILNIFLDRQEIIFVEEESEALIRIKENIIYYENRKFSFDTNLSMKRILFDILKNLTEKSSAWGILTGSKPLKLLENHSFKDLRDIYKISYKKIKLLKDIKENQARLKFDKNKFNIYINIPFCPNRCSYCSYPTIVSNKVDKKAYVEVLLREIREVNLPMKVDAIYIGGGTPSYIDIRDLEKILDLINEKFTFEEFTLEAGREDSLDFEKISLMKAKNVRRISLNPQSFSRQVLKNVNRDMDFENFYSLYNYAKDQGLIINMDFIIGLYGESRKTFKENFPIIKKLDPENLTFHALAQKVGSKFFEENISGDSKEARKIGEDIIEFVRENSYRPYYLYRQKNIIGNLENVGYEKNNNPQRYNILINEELENIIGLGMNANSKLTNGKKYRNSRNLRDYYQNINRQIEEKNKMIYEYIRGNYEK